MDAFFCYACRTGISSSADSFSSDYAHPEKSLAQQMADKFKVELHAFLCRSNYEAVIRKKNFVGGKDVASEAIASPLKSARVTREGKAKEEGTNAYALWRKQGGIDMPVAGETPKGLTPGYGRLPAKYDMIRRSILLCAALAIVYCRSAGERLCMSCGKIDAKQWKAVGDRFEREPLFVPAKQTGAVHFRIKPPNGIQSSGTLMIYSHRVNAAVYRGPVEPEISFHFDGRLLSTKGTIRWSSGCCRRTSLRMDQ
jgi:hypothetical protein